MQFDAGLIDGAATLAREHQEVIRRLPATVHAFILVELQKWTTLFAAEQRYQQALLEYLSGLPRSELLERGAGIARVETEAGCNKIGGGDPRRFQDEAQALLRKRSLVSAWRTEVDAFFQAIDPELDARLHPADAPRRLVVQIYGAGIAIQEGSIWSRFKGTGIRMPLTLDPAPGSDAFLRALFGARTSGGGEPALFAAAAESGFAPLDAWLVDSHEPLLDSWSASQSPSPSAASVTSVSYDRLRGYRDDLTRALYAKIQSGVESPQAFAAYARSLTIAPASGTWPHSPDLLRAFVRDIFLTGNGTLFVNNTFVEWAAVQALRRAQPRLLVTRFGVRDRLKPFSSLLLFSQPRASDRIPLIEDPLGSFVDVEQLSYYVWLNAEKSAAYRNKTLYLFLAEGFDGMLAIRSDAPRPTVRVLSAATLADVCATMAHWLGLKMSPGTGSVIAPLVA
jgi:hypothetical protein